jgi:hypothetical protein
VAWNTWKARLLMSAWDGANFKLKPSVKVTAPSREGRAIPVRFSFTLR